MVDYQFVTDRLAVGGAIGTSENMREMARAGVTHVVDMQIEFDDHTISGGTGVAVLWNGCDDDLLPKPSDLFWKGVLFSLGALRISGSKIYFHCAAGVHRGPLMLLAVLRALGEKPAAALEMIFSARPQASFPPVYLESVEEFIAEFEASGENADSLSRPRVRVGRALHSSI